ncbi:glycosyltransferase [Niastella sp. OAS944]|uniref:glycosyltransferase n=1 Tax=Niastella sp. OAS944 TaxID=2664089 RepID=UPI003483E193|nr:glycosyltransferase involved in cell wall biosynthesis [Chitinophagaceae bacterium OAS944]
MQNKQIVISHSGKQHSYYVAKALYDLGNLKRFYTSSYITSIVLQRLIEKAGLSFLSRRYLQGLGGKYVGSAWKYEVREQVVRRLKGNTPAITELVFKRDVAFDNDLSRKLSKLSFDAYWGFQGSCRNCLAVSNEMGKPSICEMTIAHVPFAKRILQEEAALHPEWADSIDFASFPAYFEKRMVEEPVIAQKVIAISAFLKQTLVQEGIDESKVTVIPLGFDAKSVSFSEESESIANRPLRLLYAGRVTQRKGIKYALEAMRAFNKKDVELHIIGNLYGSGNAFKSYKDKYQYRSGITQQELFKTYQQYDALLFPSILEGFGLVTVEAMGAGLPVITTPNTNATEVIRDRKNGFLVPIRDTQAIIKAIEELRGMDNITFQQMRYEARKTALQYTWDSYTNRVSDFIKEI